MQTLPPEQGRAVMLIGPSFVEVPVTVKDANGSRISGLIWKDFTVHENNIRVALQIFSVDPAPLSIAIIIDQTLPSNIMNYANQSLSTIQSALVPDDEVAIFTYTNGAKEWTGFTSSRGARLPAVLSLVEEQSANLITPTITQNENDVHRDDFSFTNVPKIRTLNDAILQAAKELSARPKARRRIVYVISDGKEYGSKATWKELVRYLESNNIAVYATLVSDSAKWAEGWLDPMHLPFDLYDNILYRYVRATGGDIFCASNVNNIEESYAEIFEEARNQYMLGYLSHESLYDGKFRSIDLRVGRPNVIVTAKVGYYPPDRDYK